jgi:hypothetical protein
MIILTFLAVITGALTYGVKEGMGYFEGGNAAATRSIGFTVNLAF